MGQGFFAVDMLAKLERGQGGEGVGVFTGTHHHRIKLAGVIVEFPEILDLPCLGKLGGGPIQVGLVNVTERDDVFGFHAIEIGTTPAPGADDGNIQFGVEVLTTDDGRSGEGRSGRGGRRGKKTTAGHTGCRGSGRVCVSFHGSDFPRCEMVST